MNSFAVIALAGTLATGYAPPIGDGHDLLKQCSATVRFLDGEQLDPDGTAADSQCRGFIHGITIANVRAKMMINLFSENTRCTGGPLDSPSPVTRDDLLALFAVNYCEPIHSSLDDTIRAVVAWLDKHPHRLSDRAGFLVFDALVDSFPCEDTPGSENVPPSSSPENPKTD